MSREVFRQTAGRALVGRKYSPERLHKILQFAAEMPVIADICRRAAISRTSLKYYLGKSEKGKPGDGFDLVDGHDEDGNPIKRRFHEMWQDAFDAGIDKVEKVAIDIAKGQYDEVLTHKGRVIYKEDPELVRLGMRGADAYLIDEITGEPVPETIRRLDTDMTRFILKTHRPKVYGDRTSIDVTHRGGVLVVGVQKTEAELEKAYGGPQEVQDVEFEDVTADDTIEVAESE